jgi:hypothetical protein
VGFAEGDGCFFGDRKTKRLFFKIRQKEPQILYDIRGYLGFGGVSSDRDGYFTYTVSKRSQILELVNIFNGKLVLKKTNERFVEEWLDNLKVGVALSSPIVYKGPAVFVGLQNAWLCGLTEADGSFGFQVSRAAKGRKGQLKIYWYIDQSFALQDFQEMLSTLSLQAAGGLKAPLKNTPF